jgi:hypothetical protein
VGSPEQYIGAIGVFETQYRNVLYRAPNEHFRQGNALWKTEHRGSGAPMIYREINHAKTEHRRQDFANFLGGGAGEGLFSSKGYHVQILTI